MINFPSSPTIGQEHTENGKTWAWDGARWMPKATAADPAEAIHAAPAKAVPADADEFGFVDSAASWSLKKLTWAGLKAALLAYFRGQFREKLTAPRTYYVRTDGSDGNTGLSNTAGGAFATIQKAIDTVAALDLGVYDATIMVGAGTWTVGSTLKTLVGAGKCVIRGVNSDMTSTIVSTVGSCFGMGSGYMGIYHLKYMGLTKSGAGATIGGDGGGGTLLFDNLDFGPTSAGSHIVAGAGQLIQAEGPYLISGGAGSHIGAYDGGQIRVQSRTVTLTGTPVFSAAFARVSRCGTALLNGNTFTGAATGARYAVDTVGVLLTLGGATYLPGNAAGTTATGGQYV